ncbi:TIGR01777 family oxidoreductase [Actinopolyspora mortivallis]|uniref:TIGR01777 family oxidoreductase n=1 Tax=Actinopolyspora mortivallis TaxID=33906 RepID=UPI0003673788|nr:TIGR01777 family oxidoreductase [Actinopolyspora mortivallis]
MRVVLAGSSGLIGSHLVPALRQQGHDVLRLVRREPQAPDERGWDPYGGRLDDRVLDGADAVINLCGAPIGGGLWTEQRRKELSRSRVTPTTVLAEAVRRNGVPALLNASATGFYGDTGRGVVTESAGPGNGFLAELCRRWETAAETASPSRVVLLRTGPVISPSGGLLGPLKPLFSLMLGGKIGDGTQYVPWISLDDETAAIRFVLENPRISGPVNLTAPEPVSNAEFTRAFAEALGRPAPWVVPAFLLRTALGDLAREMILSGQRAVPAVLEEHGFVFRHPRVRAALGAAVSA